MTDHTPTLFDAVDEHLTRLGVFDAKAGGVRRTDPESSHESARRVAGRTGSQRFRLLTAWSDGRHRTREEAAIHADLNLRSNYRARASELRDAGLIVATGDTRRSTLDGIQQVYVITPEGQRVLREVIA